MAFGTRVFKRAVACALCRKSGLRSGTGARRLGPVAVDEKRLRLALHDLGADDYLLDRVTGDHAERLFLERELDVLHLEEALVLLHERVLGLLEDALQRHLVEVLERGNDWQTADELGDEAELEKVLGLD